MLKVRLPTPAFLVALATAFSLLGDQALYAVLPVIHADLGLSALQVGLLLSVNRWIRLLTNEFAHRLAASRAPACLLSGALLLGAVTTGLREPVGLERSSRAEWESEDSFSRFRGAWWNHATRNRGKMDRSSHRRSSSVSSPTGS